MLKGTSLFCVSCTETEYFENWGPLKCLGIPKKRETYNLNFTDNYDWHTKVESSKTWEHVYCQITKSAKDWNSTSFGFDLSETEARVLIKF